jgi:hypothetical protein
MKCSNPDCTRGIGLVSHRRGWLDRQRYCSKRCRDAISSQVTPSRSSPQRLTTSYFEWLFSQPTGGSRLRPGQPGLRVTTSFV